MKRWIISIFAAASMAFIHIYIPFEGLTPGAKLTLIIFLVTIIFWIVRPIPEYLTSIFAAAVLIVFARTPGGQVLSGFNNMAWWMTVFAMILGATISHTGLGRRLAYIFLAKYAKGPLQILYATSMVNNILAPFMPSNTARGALLSNVSDSICEGVGFKPGEYKGDHTIMLANLYTNTTNTFMFLTATGANMLGLKVIKDMTGMDITWNTWFMAGFFPGLPVVLLLPFIVYKMFPFGMSSPEVARALAKERLAEMGPVTRAEKRTLIILLLTGGFWVTEFLHGIPSTHTSFILAFLLVPGVGAVSWKDIGERVSWPALIWLGMAMGMADVINRSGGFKWIVDTLFAKSSFMSGMGITEFSVILICGTVFMHIIFAGMNAMMMVMVPIAISIAQQRGFDPYAIGIITTMAVAGGAFFMPFNSAPNLIFYGTGRYDVRHQFIGAVPLALLICIALVLALFLWWPMIGLI
ncbi:MAG: anion permease [Deltaproteobacteria bacterium]|nr:anion permease [Deltaproteobacteria bacterium]